MAYLASKFLGAVAQPNGVWEKIIMAFHNGIHNYAWAIIVFTIVLKVILLPLDFLNKYVTVKNTKVQQAIQPELEKIQKQYGNNKQMINQKTMELYKKNNYSVTGSCVIMLVNMALTLTIFITLFSGLNSMAAYKVQYQYNEIQKSYYSLSDYSVDNLSEKYSFYYNEYAENPANLNEEGNFDAELAKIYALDNVKTDIATYNNEINNANALQRYGEVKESWLWIDNIWKSDTPWTNSVATFSEYSNSARATFKDVSIKNAADEEIGVLSANDLKALAEVEYNQIMDPIRASAGRANGYLIVVILAAGLNLISILASQGKLKFKRKKKTTLEEEPKQKQPGGWLMLILLPAIMIYITLMYNAVFGLYIFVSSLVSTAATPLINWIINIIDKKKQLKKAKEATVSYSRKK